MSSAARDWLALQSASVPTALSATLSRAVSDVAEQDSAVSELAEAALASLRHALQQGDDRAAALQLLAADALVTAACEAAAADAGELAALAQRFSPERVAALLAHELRTERP